MGVLVLWEEGSRYPGAIGITSVRLALQAGAAGMGPRRQREGRGVSDVAVHLLAQLWELDLDCEVVSPVPACWEREVVEGRGQASAQRASKSQEKRSCATAPQGDFLGWQASHCWSTEEARGTWQEAGRVLAMNAQGA